MQQLHLSSYRTLGYASGLLCFVIWLFAVMTGVTLAVASINAVFTAVIGLAVMRKFAGTMKRPRDNDHPRRSKVRWVPPQMWEGLAVFFTPWLALVHIADGNSEKLIIAILCVCGGLAYTRSKLNSTARSTAYRQ